MLKNMSDNIARFFYNKEIIKQEDIVIYSYGLELLLSTFLEVSTILILSLYFKNFIQTIMFFISFIPLRTYAGGYHAKNHLRCFGILLLNYLVILTLLHTIPENAYLIFIVITQIIALVSVIFMAPIDSDNKKLTDSEKKIYRSKSIHIVYVQIAVIFACTMFFRGINVFVFSISLGQLSACLSMWAVKIQNKRKGDKNEECNVDCA